MTQFESDAPLPAIPRALLEEMARIGPVWGQDTSGHIARMTEAFSDILATAPDRGVTCRAGLTYGGHERQRLDIYAGLATPPKAPALLFVHGGAFVQGDRNKTSQIYSNVLRYFAAHGMVGVNIGYRLADAAPYPGATEDIAGAVAWVRRHTNELGVDPDRIFLMGHSAGGAHAASYALNPRFHAPGGSGLAGLVVVSGRVRADVLPENPNAAKVKAYYGSDTAALEEASAVTHVSARSLPVFVAWAEFENPLIDVHCSELVYRLAQARRKSPPMLWLRGHNHTSSIAHLNTADETLGREILAFVANPR